MSAVLAIASPRRIKATHRRRRKVAAGHFVQRYCDPGIGRFLSNDPVTANTKNGGNFNRYWYANNNPYRFTDPDGRYVCDGAVACKAAATGLAAVNAALKNPANSGKTNATLSATVAFYGKAGVANGVVVKAANLPGRTGGDAMTYSVKGEPKGLQTVIRLDVSQAASDAKLGGVGAGAILGGTMVHEGVHGATQRTGEGNVSNVRSEINLDEIKAYTAEARFDQGAGVNPYGLLKADGTIDSRAVGQGADRSTNAVCAKPGACE